MKFDDGSQEQVKLSQWQWRLAEPPKRAKKPRPDNPVPGKEPSKPCDDLTSAPEPTMQPPVSCARAPRPMRPAATATKKPPLAVTKSATSGVAAVADGAWEFCGPGLRDAALKGTRYEA